MKPILFNAEMVRAILDGRKTVTRRVIRNVPNRDDLKPYEAYGEYGLIATNSTVYHFKPPYRPGDILYVRETWQHLYVPELVYIYYADSDGREERATRWKGDWRPSIHMPYKAARIFLKVTNVRVERLQDITEEQALLEGAKKQYQHYYDNVITELEVFQGIWNSTIKPKDRDVYGWGANPFVWCILFEKISKEEAERDI